MKTLPYDMLDIAGGYTDSGWIPFPEWVIKGSFNISKPIPDSYKKHFLSEKYFKLLIKHKPELFARVMFLITQGKISPESYKERKMKEIKERMEELEEKEKELEEKEKELKEWEEKLNQRELTMRKRNIITKETTPIPWKDRLVKDAIYDWAKVNCNWDDYRK